MASPAQAFANLANAQLSTGPRTAEGKAIVAKNATKHGFTAAKPVVRPGEEEQFEALDSSLRADLRPEGTIEAIVFARILHASWNLQRIDQLESDLTMEALTAPAAQQTDRDETPSYKTKPIALDPMLDEAFAPQFDRLQRYRASAERTLFRALKELRAQQTLRAERLAAPREVAELLPPQASIRQITKQSQSAARQRQDLAIERYMNGDDSALEEALGTPVSVGHAAAAPLSVF